MIEAMKQALEALEDFVDVIKYDNEQDDIGRRACCDVLSYNPHSESCKAKQAITAIKEAIRERALYEVQRFGQEIEQEPVAWMSEDEHTVYTSKQVDGCFQHDHIPLYTHPPQRTWVGLTDEEIAQGCKESWVTEQAWQSAVWWAEAKLKELNT
jgi:hypothetical protein